MDNQKHFEVGLGGKIFIKPVIEYLPHAVNRIKEISAMAYNLANPISTKMIFQKLPIHMRRRAMSYNAKRLPRRLREAHMEQIAKSGVLPNPPKRPSRKFRRRPKNLLKDYIRRQRNFVWLETHIWHAKRFHMKEHWGYKLPEAPCNKSFRSSYRATSSHCLLQDISYYGCIQLSGKYDSLIAGLKLNTNPLCGLTFAAKAFLNGKREGRVTIFKKNSFPYNAIGEVTFIWKPEEDLEAHKRTIWIFAHPAFYNDVLENFLDCFHLKLHEDTESIPADVQVSVESEVKEFEAENMDTEVSEKDEQRKPKQYGPGKLHSDIKKLEARNIPFSRTKKYFNKKGIELVELKDTLNRFRLTGPLSQVVLSKTLEPLSTNGAKTWFKTHLKKPNFEAAHKSQILFWERISSVQSPAQLPSHLVLGLNVVDPRLNRPEKRMQAMLEISENIQDLTDIPENISCSALWESSTRDQIIQKKLSTHGLNKLRNKYCLVPGEPSEFELHVQGIPIILIQSPGSQVTEEKRVGYGSGWDIIIPSGYAMPIWLSLILYGARAGGTRESKSIAFESLKSSLAPDTAAGQLEEESVNKRMRTAYFKLAPNKRINYIKYGINSPFLCRWNILLNDWTNNSSNEFYVLRDFRLLSELQEYVQNKRISSQIDFMSRCLIPITLTLVNKGAPGDFSIICLPKVNVDIPNKRKKKPDISTEIEEPLHEDTHKSERDHSREEHLRLLKRLRQRRVRAKRLLQETSNTPVKIEKLNNKNIIDNQLKKMQQLWLPEDIATVRHQCNYEVMGYVTNGDFSFTEAGATGVGYVTLSSIHTLMTQFKKNLVLVRNTSSKKYRHAYLRILK